MHWNKKNSVFDFTVFAPIEKDSILRNTTCGIKKWDKMDNVAGMFMICDKSYKSWDS